MNASFQIGNRIVLATLAASLVLCLTFAGMTPTGSPRAAEDLGENGWPIGSFQLTERSGKLVTESDLSDTTWIAAFIFTRCPLSCPRISTVMKSLQGQLGETRARLVSISVDPEHDTPEVLSAYARRFDADPDHWWFLTGPTDVVHELIADRFKLSVAAADESVVKAGGEAFSHSDRLALVDKGKVIGLFDSNDPERVKALLQRARELAAKPPAWAGSLPAVNATLNATCAVLLLLGWMFIRSGRPRAHAATMISCVAVSALFLGCYLVYHYHVGSVPYRGVGAARILYLSILLSHTLLATFGVVPLVLATLIQAARRQFVRHARIARITFPIWLYVSVTGVVIYFMLYQLPVPTGS